MQVVRNIVYVLFLCCVPVVLLTSTIYWEVTEIRLYEYGINKYEISRVTGIDEKELKRIHQHLIDYYNLKVESAQVIVTKDGEEFHLFNERELIHLEDVKNLVRLDLWVQRVAFTLIVICSLMFLLWLRDSWLILVKGLFRGSLATLGLVVILALFSVFGFERLFILFHLVSFTNEFWILDPSRDYLIMLFPESFFYDAAMFGFGAVLIQTLFLGSATFGVMKLKGGAKG